jgi:hypothetical protein
MDVLDDATVVSKLANMIKAYLIWDNDPWLTAHTPLPNFYPFLLILTILDGIALWKVGYHTHLLFQSNQCFSDTIRMGPLIFGMQNLSRVSLV